MTAKYRQFKVQIILFIYSLASTSFGVSNLSAQERFSNPAILDKIKIDSVWAGHPVGFCLLTHENRQYIAYYNSDRKMVVGQRNLDESKFDLHPLPLLRRETSGGTSTILGWDSHNSVTLAIDKEGYIHLAGNMHVHPLTYFRSKNPDDVSEMVQYRHMVGTEENRCTYPKFMKTREGELLFHYRDGGSGNGNEIYNIYSTEKQEWTRLLDAPLTDGQGLMNAYQSQPTLLQDNWYHVYWVWRDTPDCETNHDLSYIKSPDLKNWYNAYDDPVDISVTYDDKSVIVDPIPSGGGIINLSARLCLDKDLKPVFVYHKYGPKGNLQFFIARLVDDKWEYKQITDWDYRWEFQGRGSIVKEVRFRDFTRTKSGYKVSFYHIKHGEKTFLLNNDFDIVQTMENKKEKEISFPLEGDFPGLQVLKTGDTGKPESSDVKYIIKWETLPNNRDRPRGKPWPNPSQLYLYKIKNK
ncbi:BNR repeat-containing protein [Membranihabitans maritimus]|uniref:BNR repeat-containing protein n=1 Tax=Membranihabitans maritimus TaxID=2904244 RepID=UPI001F2E6D46|nr:BNR repeat-containing protein [Membranihabitans maritimus]